MFKDAGYSNNTDLISIKITTIGYMDYNYLQLQSADEILLWLKLIGTWNNSKLCNSQL